MDWIIENKEWLFSGIGVSLVIYLISLFIKFKSKKSLKQKQSSGKNSINLQSGNDINIGNQHDK